MRLIGDSECYSKMNGAAYGFDAYGNKVEPLEGWRLIERNEKIEKDDQPFDVYSGWLGKGFINMKYVGWASSGGRWTTYARKI